MQWQGYHLRGRTQDLRHLIPPRGFLFNLEMIKTCSVNNAVLEQFFGGIVGDGSTGWQGLPLTTYFTVAKQLNCKQRFTNPQMKPSDWAPTHVW